jgi:nitrogen regulatory protein P-II 1
MKRVEAIIRPHKVPHVLAALAQAGITNVTVIETSGLARQMSHSRIYEPANPNNQTQTGLIPKRLLLLYVEDEQVQPALDLIRSIALTGEPGDGKIAVSQLDQLVRIRPKGDPSQPQ